MSLRLLETKRCRLTQSILVALLITLELGQPGQGTAQSLPAGYAAVSAATSRGTVSLVMPRKVYAFDPIGDTYYVALTGKDSNNGSKSYPFKTIEKGLSVLEPGDLLYIRGGDYYTPFTVDISGESDQPIIISNYPGETVRILQPVGWQKANYNSATVTLKSVRYVWLHGLDIQGCRGRADAPAPDKFAQNALSLCNGAGEGVKILNNSLSKALHCGVKEMGHGGSRILIEGNLIFDNGLNVNNDHGIYIPGKDVVIRGNAIFRNAGFGIHLYNNPTRIQVYNNLIFEHPRDGIMQAGSEGLFANNVAVRNRYGLKLFRDKCVGNTFVNNIFMNNAEGQVGMDNAGGKCAWPSNNLVDYSVAYPSYRWALPAGIVWMMGVHMMLKDPSVENYSGNDLRLKSTSSVKKQAVSLTMKGAYSWPDPGLFPATQYTDPVW